MIYILALFYFFQTENKHIHWSDKRKLTVNDFKKIDRSQNRQLVKGTTYSYIESWHEIHNTTLLYRIYSYFDTDSSWMEISDVRLHHNDRHIIDIANQRQYTIGLTHEQKHFDIIEVYSRKIRRMLSKNINATDVKYVDDSIDAYLNSCEKFQIKYDNETINSMDTLMQDKWNIKIQKMLDSLEE